jgi:hypothetical protein
VAGVASAAIVSGELIIGLDDGTIIRAGYVQGPTGLTGPQGPMGSTGPAGRDGNGLLHGAGVPTFNDGKDGDFYIDIKEWKAYGPKTGGKWGSGVALLPKDRGGMLPTGMRTQGSGASGARAFAAGISGPSSGGVPSAGPATGSLELIIGHNQPLLANTPSPVAIDTTGDAMIVDLWAQGPQGTLFVEVAVSKGAGTDTGYSVVYEVRMGAVPPVLTFTPGTNVAGTDLQLQVSSDVNLVTLRGRIMKI